MKILHIEDSSEISAIFSDILTMAKHEFESTIDGKIGLDLVLKNNYDLILLDIGLPEYTGFDFLVDLKIKKPSEIEKVIIVSSLQLEEYQRQFLKNLGVHSIQQKPISVQHLMSKIIPKMAQ
jgi:DNA-binding response OmpR family regulator